MSRIIRELLQVHERDFSRYISRLEKATMQSGIDIRLSIEIAQRIREKTRFLGLLEDNVTEPELYLNILRQLASHDAKFRDTFKLKFSSPQLRARKLAILATKVSKQDKVLSISPAGCKRIILAVPPKRTMKLLKSKSLVSLLKREDPRILYILARSIEDATWHSQVLAKIKRLQAKDFGWQQPESIALSSSWYEKTKLYLNDQGLQILCPEMGITLILPVITQAMDGIFLYAFGSIVQALQKCTTESMANVQHGLSTGYQAALSDIALGVQPLTVSIHGIQPNWHVVYELIMKGHLKRHIDDFELVLGEMTWQTVEMKIASLVPGFDFWIDTHYIGKPSEHGTVSFHFLDAARNLVVGASFGEQTAHHMEGSLWNELHVRYLQHESLIRKLANQLAPQGGTML